jgi:hypothetical protein
VGLEHRAGRQPADEHARVGSLDHLRSQPAQRHLAQLPVDSPAAEVVRLDDPRPEAGPGDREPLRQILTEQQPSGAHWNPPPALLLQPYDDLLATLRVNRTTPAVCQSQPTFAAPVGAQLDSTGSVATLSRGGTSL